MPIGQTLDSAGLGAAFGVFPIMWIVWNALWIYNMTDATGLLRGPAALLRRISDDQRVQAVIIAFSFGALLEALAGFGTPVAITAVMLIALGFQPIKAASVALVSNTAPVAFGAIAVPIVTLAEITGLPKDDLGAMVGRQTPLLALFVPLILVGMVDGTRGIRAAWPAALAGGLAFAVGQFACSNYVSVELTDIVASLPRSARSSCCCSVWQPLSRLRGERPPGAGPAAIAGAESYNPALEAEHAARGGPKHHDTPGEVFARVLPYLVIIVVFSLAQYRPVKDWLTSTGTGVRRGRASRHERRRRVLKSHTFKFDWLRPRARCCSISGLITIAALRVRPRARAAGVRRRRSTSSSGQSSRWPRCWRWPT